MHGDPAANPNRRFTQSPVESRWSVRCAAVSTMRRVLHEGQTPRPLQEIGHKIVVPTVVTAGAREAVGKDAAFQVFVKGLAHKGPRCVVVALAVELACAGQRMPSLEVLGYCAYSSVRSG